MKTTTKAKAKHSTRKNMPKSTDFLLWRSQEVYVWGEAQSRSPAAKGGQIGQNAMGSEYLEKRLLTRAW